MNLGDMLAPEAQPEEWRTIAGYEGLYEVSSLGRVRRMCFVLGRNMCRYPYNPPRISLQHMGRGYLRVSLCKDGKPRFVSVHVLVCTTWHGPKPTPLHQAAHWDGIKTHNFPHNLRWATPKENAEDRERHGTTLRGEDVGMSKLTSAQVLEIRARRPAETVQSLAEEYGVTGGLVSAIATRRIWKHI